MEITVNPIKYSSFITNDYEVFLMSPSGCSEMHRGHGKCIGDRHSVSGNASETGSPFLDPKAIRFSEPRGVFS
ncbi:MAG TPA: hypothetical protein PK529_13495, partial [Verrucomicrobiales bacterium]|nr:hypothetical protein [Verrucomicrobiales bacterium]